MPVAPATQSKEDGVSGEETQQVQLVVADVEEEAGESEPEEDKDTAKDKGTNCRVIWPGKLVARQTRHSY